MPHVKERRFAGADEALLGSIPAAIGSSVAAGLRAGRSEQDANGRQTGPPSLLACNSAHVAAGRIFTLSTATRSIGVLFSLPPLDFVGTFAIFSSTSSPFTS